MADEVALVNFWPSPYSMRTKIALSEKGIEYKSIEENLLETLRNNKSQLLLKMNPVHKKIPVLIHNDRPICESLIQIQYIDEVWKDKGSSILPSDPYQRSQARFWAEFADKVIECTRNVWGRTGEEQEAAVREFIESLKILEQQLADKPFFGGETFGFLDIALVPLYSWCYALEKCGNFSVEKECPKIIAWGKRCLEKDSVSKSLPNPEKLYELVSQLKKTYGIE